MNAHQRDIRDSERPVRARAMRTSAAAISRSALPARSSPDAAPSSERLISWMTQA
jgi:hypothetical protein